MFLKKIEFITLLAFYRYFKPALVIKQITLVSLLLSFGALVVLLTFFNGILIRSFLASLAFFFIVYWTVSIFVYLFKKSQYGVFNRIIQRFWKRSLWLFWALELFLFLIYLFLSIISPQEVAYMLDNSQLLFDTTFNLKLFFKNLSYALFIVLVANAQLLLHKYNSARAAASALICVLLIRASFDDFTQFYAINNYYSSYNWAHISVESENFDTSKYAGVWELESAELKTRTACHYFYVLIFLKLWHTLFIFAFFLFFENISTRLNLTSFNALSANLQNFYFLMFFNYILKIVMLKQYFVYLGGYVFFWFYVNINNYDISYIYQLYSHEYLFFFVRDFITKIC